jgi:hypothetical protein
MLSGRSQTMVPSDQSIKKTFVLAIAMRAGYLMDCQHEVVSKAID